MSLPPGFLDELRNRISLSQVVGRKVLWDNRKSNPARGDLWAPCPFHEEKTASFHVDDRKGYYYCFGCHAKGDAISFVRETENMGFMEAVEQLAQEVGLPMPARDPRAQEKADARQRQTDVMEQAVRFYRIQLSGSAGGEARDYLARRGLSPEVQDQFGIGFAPPGWQNLHDHLTGQGVPEALLLETGLVRPSQQGRDPYDTFRNRIIFPIRDARGRAIAFGGRAMDPGENAKYLNSPETALFDKSRTLYNVGPAREAAGKGAQLVVAEGYMDVIALSAAGFEAAVAPLGTAITEHQLHMLWRISDEPVVALDGDRAGLNAAYRLIDLALPLLEAGRSLRFALLPEGKDPDDLIRDGGGEAMRAVLKGAVPLVRLLWRRETEGKVFDSPERKAALDKELRARLRTIADPGLRAHYGEEFKRLRYELFRGGSRSPVGGGRFRAPPPRRAPLPDTRGSLLVSGGEGVEDHLREAVIFATLLTHPDILPDFEAQLEDLSCQDPVHATLRELMLTHDGAEADLKAAADAAVGGDALEILTRTRHVAITPCLRHPGDNEIARMTVAEELAKLVTRKGLAAEIAEAAEELHGPADEAVTWRLSQAAQARHTAQRAQSEDKTEYDTGPNGAPINREERSALDALMETIRFDKRRK